MANVKVKLSAAQQKFYAEEKEYNFRQIAHLLGTRSKYTLTDADLITDNDISEDHPSETRSSSLIADLSAWGEFAEIAHGNVDPAFVLREIDALISEGFPFEGYTALAEKGVELVGLFKGPGKEGVQGYVAVRPGTKLAKGGNINKEVVVAFSGTSSIWQVFKDLDVRWLKYPVPSSQPVHEAQGTSATMSDKERQISRDQIGSHEEKRGSPSVHKGFSRLYSELRPPMVAALSAALQQHPSADIVITGHSMGGSMSYMLALDILFGPSESNGQVIDKIQGRKLTIATFGCPRIGNAALVLMFNDGANAYRKHHGLDKFNEFAVKAFDDGAPCLPPYYLCYRHMCQTPFYLYHGRLYRVPAREAEHSFFNVEQGGSISDDGKDIIYPLGGHNYYNNRNMERPLHLLSALKLKTLGEDGWKDRYLKTLRKT